MGKPRRKAKPKIETFADILPKVPIMPDENPMDFEVFQAGLLKELGPNSPYQNIVVQNIIANEWEMFRLRRWRRALIAAEAEKQLLRQVAGPFSFDDEPKDESGFVITAAMQENQTEQAEALEELRELGHDPTRYLAIAYSHNGDIFENLEYQIMGLENRLKRLWEDLNTLKAVRSAAILDEKQF